MHSLQQEKVRDIINSRHLAFPVKMADIHQAVKIAGFHVHSGLKLRAFSQHVSAQLAHLCIFNSSSTTKHSSSCWPSVYSKLPVKPIATTSPCSFWEVAGTCLAPHALWSSSGLPTYATGMLFCLSLLWLLGPWSHTMTLLLFAAALARKLQQRGSRSKRQIMENRENRALESLNEQSLWLHGWVQASFRLSGTLAENVKQH